MYGEIYLIRILLRLLVNKCICIITHESEINLMKDQMGFSEERLVNIVFTEFDQTTIFLNYGFNTKDLWKFVSLNYNIGYSDMWNIIIIDKVWSFRIS